ncbi:MAG: 2,5-diamino-6-(ribosylamino)-4(3H)-pyrimidinone 5'-phosphate reductase [Thermoplasmata archaeon]|nr:MAG: 2,5-diamino-6-(ribosylamino)-4(3H)-pyrimidinone 5'-phosphate reductase [Thermoplasmata archaeon]
MHANRPNVIINCAMSVDGKLALPMRKQTRISSQDDMDRVYKLRSMCDAIIVGVGTILADDPGLVVKLDGKLSEHQPLRVVLDTNGRTPEGAEVLDDRATTLIAVGEDCTTKWAGAETIVCGKEKIDIKQLLEELKKRDIQKVLVEGGGETIWSFLHTKLVDDMYVFIGSMVIGGKDSPTLADGEGSPTSNEIIPLDLEEMRQMEGGILLHYRLM